MLQGISLTCNKNVDIRKVDNLKVFGSLQQDSQNRLRSPMTISQLYISIINMSNKTMSMPKQRRLGG